MMGLGLRLAFVISLLSTAECAAQRWPFELWHEGKVVLESGDTLKGLVKYDMAQDLVQYELQNVRTEAFTARKLVFFEIFDETVRQYRQFYALPYMTSSGYRIPVFFELLTDGKITLLCREAVEVRTVSSPYYYGTYSREVLAYRYFLLEPDGSITDYEPNKSDLLKRMGKRSSDVQKYAKVNRLKYDEKLDLAKIIKYYNSFFK